jgi:hypothetical protein
MYLLSMYSFVKKLGSFFLSSDLYLIYLFRASWFSTFLLYVDALIFPKFVNSKSLSQMLDSGMLSVRMSSSRWWKLIYWYFSNSSRIWPNFIYD